MAAVAPPTMTTMAMAKRRAATTAGSTADVPIFLQKAYHMIDTCNPNICGWSEDGLTFIVKNTALFETTIIPQFFKHNKFSSFVRQLNFYGFRKVKFSNSLKIDHKLEAETAKFWRFRHESFRRGRKDLLTEIKRTPSAGSTASSATKTVVKAVVPHAVNSSNVQPVVHNLNMNAKTPEDVTKLKTEMQEMKQRMASMSRNIDELTDMVKKVSVNESEGGISPVVSPGAAKLVEPEFGIGNKRKKIEAGQFQREVVAMEELPVLPDWNSSSEYVDTSSTEFVDSLLLGDQPLPEPLPDLAMSGRSLPPTSPSPTPSDALSDEDFVDDLFQAFAEEGAPVPGMESLEEDGVKCQRVDENPNKPCPHLMKRIEDSLSTIPKAMHEMVANRLIDAISDSQPIAQCATSLENIKPDRSISMDENVAVDEIQPQALLAEDTPSAEGACNNGSPTASAIPLPLAVATLKTILAEYGVQVECRRSPCKEAALEGRRFSKSIPVVPMHA
mmetsp:Transcript_48855/g.103870  ORF Transcript_48855/g.103870 Transcript_48855/m.103870 type:complete len:501 (+) Transcript_48855:169-1671(+)